MELFPLIGGGGYLRFNLRGLIRRLFEEYVRCDLTVLLPYQSSTDTHCTDTESYGIPYTIYDTNSPGENVPMGVHWNDDILDRY